MDLNPWKTIRRLQRENGDLQAIAKAYGDHIVAQGRELEDAKAVSATYAQANGSLIAEVTDLRNENAALKDKVKHTHARDPKTGRILKRGQWNGHETIL